MSQRPLSEKILGVDIRFRPDADMEQARKIADFLEKKFAEWQTKTRGEHSRETVLVFLALGLADELLQLRNDQAETALRLQNLFAKIEKSL